MADEPLRRTHDAVLLREDSVGVTTENEPRKIQLNGRAFYTTMSPSWLDQLNIAEKSAETLHSLTTGQQPVIVQHPAIIVQPKHILEEAGVIGGPKYE